MYSIILFRWLPSSIVLLGLAGCAEFDQRKGLDPVINGASVQTASYNKSIIINALAEDAGYRPGEPVDYYNVAEAGFNYVDDQCRSYFDKLFFIDRGRGQLKSGLAATSATTAAILGVTQASAPSLAIVAAAFGLASAATDIVAGTYLYALPPATTQGFVEKLQLAFREAASAAASRDPRRYTLTYTYFLIQQYLNLCLPPTIEAEITKHINSASATFTPSDSGAFFTVQPVGAPPSAVPTVGPSPVSFSKTGPGSSAMGHAITTAPSHPIMTGKTPLPGTHLAAGGLPGAITLPEKKMTAAQLARFQRDVLCVPENPEFDSLTRDGIKIFEKSAEHKSVATGQIEDLERQNLDFYDRTGQVCPPDAQNFYELRAYFVQGKLQPDLVIELQKKLNERVEGGQIEENGSLDKATRDKIEAVRQSMGDLGDPPSAKRQVTLAFRNALKRGGQ
jgi:hypothetical protein